MCAAILSAQCSFASPSPHSVLGSKEDDAPISVHGANRPDTDDYVRPRRYSPTPVKSEHVLRDDSEVKR
jgi:hypothetical protein